MTALFNINVMFSLIVLSAIYREELMVGVVGVWVKCGEIGIKV